MRTLFEKYLQENNIKYLYTRCTFCNWKIYLLIPDEHKFQNDLGSHEDFNYHLNFDMVENCPKCNRIRVW